MLPHMFIKPTIALYALNTLHHNQFAEHNTVVSNQLNNNNQVWHLTSRVPKKVIKKHTKLNDFNITYNTYIF